MGKKELKIRKLNNAFHAEENARYTNKHDEGDVVCDYTEIDEKAEESILHAYHLLREYADHQGLPICQNLSFENMSRYMNFISGIPPSTTRVPEPETEPETEPEPEPETEPEPEPEPVRRCSRTIKQIDVELEQIRVKSVLTAGQYALYNEYKEFCNNTKAIPCGAIEFHKRLCYKREDKYDSLIQKVGEIEYRRVQLKEKKH